MSTAFLRLPFSFDPAALAENYRRCVSWEWKRHFNASDFEGQWDGIALRSGSGAESDILAHPEAGYEFEADERAKAYPLEVKIQMLRQLEPMNNEGARHLAARLKVEIEAESHGVH